MNFGPKANKAFKSQQPTYHVAPNFTTRPYPDGPLDLGTLVEDLKQFYPINQGATAHVAVDQRYTDAKEDVVASLKSSASGEAGILARVLDGSIGGDATLRGQRKDENVYRIRKLETAYFFPNPAYIRQCLQLADVKDYLEMAGYKEPVYLVTGLKIAWGATISTEHGRELEGKAGADVRVPGGVVDAQAGAHAALSRESGSVSSFGKPADFVLGIQVLKIYHKRAFFSGERSLATERVVKNAVLVDDDPVDDADEEDAYTIATLGSDEVAGLGLVPFATSDNETWLLPGERK
ncbi:hypothetical protein GE09DRAFT_28898 [Coniochaeta sp. 2T2.1]|nr:hypothetical protein GE09DRAFT_28898 [Coniochaeta sp. 2T2.1]